jgi:hypothetical protein
MKHNIDISFLLATRGRTQALDASVQSIFDLADRPERVEIFLGFDRDDEVGLNHWQYHLKPWLDQHGHKYTAMRFEPMGYIRLHEYTNTMAKHASGEWLIIWNDDAVMQTQGWDQNIMSYQDRFRLLAFRTHNMHPYSIFPTVPRKWFELLGYISPHQAQDAWVSQQAYMLDIWERIPVDVLHDRYDLTGKNLDPTYQKRAMLEGRPSDPRDFHSVQQMDLRHRDAAKLATYLRNELGYDMTFFERVFAGKQDPWQKLAENDINSQMVQFANPHSHFARPHITAGQSPKV